MNEKRSPYPEVYIESDQALAGHTPARLSDEVYEASNARYVLVCDDVVLTDPESESFYLFFRKEKPAQGIWWPLGGSRLAGQTHQKAVEGIFSRETGLAHEVATALAADRRLQYVRHFEVIWKDRQSIPQERITHATADLFSFAPTEEELNFFIANINPKDFDAEKGARKMTLVDLVAEAEADEAAHPGMQSAYRVVIEHWHAVFSKETV